MMDPLRRKRGRRPGAVALALYLNAALLAGILVTMLARNGSGSLSLVQSARAAEGPAMVGAGNLYLIPGQFSERTYGCYLMDTDAQTICVYRFDGAATKMKLVAARNFRNDRRMGHLNTEPDPKEVEVMVETERNGRRAGAAGAEADPSSAPKSRGNRD